MISYGNQVKLENYALTVCFFCFARKCIVFDCLCIVYDVLRFMISYDLF